MAATDDSEEIIVRNCELRDEVREKAFEYIRKAVRECTVERDMALMVKKQFDVEFGPKWHCIVGRHFSSHVSYEPQHYFYAQQGRRVFLVFKAGGPPAAAA